MTQQADVLIVGGGLSGATLAASLADGRRQILVLEAQRGTSPRFAGELIHPTGVEVLERAGLLTALESAGGRAVEGFAIIPERGTPATLLPYREIVGRRPQGFAMEHRAMVARLRALAASKPRVTLRTGTRVVDVLREGGRVVGVRTERGDDLRAPLTLIAEGRHSRLRTGLGLTAEARLLSLTAALLASDAPLPHPDHGHIFLGAWGPILAYPIGDNAVRVCFDLPADGEKGTPALVDCLRRGYLSHLPEPLGAALDASLARRDIEVAANHAISTRRCVVPGAALIGDAAGCSHPLTAAGMTVCLNDVRLIGEALGPVDPADRPAIDRALTEYQERRYRFVRARELLADALYEVFRDGEDGARAIRQGIFRYWRSSGRARATSLALLSGAESRLKVFLEEYLRVVGHSIGGVVLGQLEDPSLAGRARSLGGLAQKSYEKMARVVECVRMR